MSSTHDQSLLGGPAGLLGSVPNPQRNIRTLPTPGIGTTLSCLTCSAPCRRVDWRPGVTGGSPSVAELFTHIHYVRLVFLSEDAPGSLRFS